MPANGASPSPVRIACVPVAYAHAHVAVLQLDAHARSSVVRANSFAHYRCAIAARLRQTTPCEYVK